jgi:hypothetical protein
VIVRQLENMKRSATRPLIRIWGDKVMSIFDSKDGALSIYRLVILDVAVILLLGWLTGNNGLPLQVTSLIAYPALLILNFVLFWKAYREHRLPKRTKKLWKRMWFGAVVFTAAAVVEIIYWIRSPDVRSTVQVIIGTALAGWMWYLDLSPRGPKGED